MEELEGRKQTKRVLCGTVSAGHGESCTVRYGRDGLVMCAAEMCGYTEVQIGDVGVRRYADQEMCQSRDVRIRDVEVPRCVDPEM